MLRCEDCEFFRRGSDGSPELTCDPFSTAKEPECLIKLQLIELSIISRSHEATLDMYRRFAPLQEKMFRQMEREIDETDEADRWKLGLAESESDEDDEDDDARS